MKNTIAFQKGILCTPDIKIDNRNMAMTVQAELMKFGYMLTQDALEQLGYSDAADIKEFYAEVIDYLKEMTGGLRSYAPIYPGFPTQVMEMSEYELWLNQLIGYYTGGSFTANAWTKTKQSAFEHVNYKMIEKKASGNLVPIFHLFLENLTKITEEKDFETSQDSKISLISVP